MRLRILKKDTKRTSSGGLQKNVGKELRTCQQYDGDFTASKSSAWSREYNYMPKIPTRSFKQERRSDIWPRLWYYHINPTNKSSQIKWLEWGLIVIPLFSLHTSEQMPFLQDRGATRYSLLLRYHAEENLRLTDARTTRKHGAENSSRWKQKKKTKQTFQGFSWKVSIPHPGRTVKNVLTELDRQCEVKRLPLFMFKQTVTSSWPWTGLCKERVG